MIKNATVISTAKKHWIVYLFPIVFTVAGLLLLSFEQFSYHLLGAFFIFGSLIRIVQVSTVKWVLTPEYLFVREGWPWAKEYQQIAVYDLYKIDNQKGKFSRFFNVATLTTADREFEKAVSHINISNASEFTHEVTKVLNKTNVSTLNKAMDLKEQGALTPEEYNLLKLGVMTQRHLKF
ncbi:MAG: Short C-terminal protein [Sphingobacteriales bacterium]|nr:Short C-terminal protein [Sphingobacteriales bacterium]